MLILGGDQWSLLRWSLLRWSLLRWLLLRWSTVNFNFRMKRRLPHVLILGGDRQLLLRGSTQNCIMGIVRCIMGNAFCSTTDLQVPSVCTSFVKFGIYWEKNKEDRLVYSFLVKLANCMLLSAELQTHQLLLCAWITQKDLQETLCFRKFCDFPCTLCRQPWDFCAPQKPPEAQKPVRSTGWPLVQLKRQHFVVYGQLYMYMQNADMLLYLL